MPDRIIGRYRVRKPHYRLPEHWPTHARGPKGQLKNLSQDPLETRAVPLSEVYGTLPERILYKALKQRRVPFEFQSSQNGGKQQYGGIVVDFKLLDRFIMIEVKGTYFHTQVRTAEYDLMRDAQLFRNKWSLFTIWDWQVYDEATLDDWLRRYVDFGLPMIGGSIVGGGEKVDEEDDVTLKQEIAELREELSAVKAHLYSMAPGAHLRITDANIVDLSASKITVGTLDADVSIGTSGKLRAGDDVGHGVTITRDVIRMTDPNNVPVFFVDGANRYLQIGLDQWAGGNPLIYDNGVLILPGETISPGSITADKLRAGTGEFGTLLADEIIARGMRIEDPDDPTDYMILDDESLRIYKDGISVLELRPGVGLISLGVDATGITTGPVRFASHGINYDTDGNGWMRGYHSDTHSYPTYTSARYWDYMLDNWYDYDNGYCFAVRVFDGTDETENPGNLANYVFGKNELFAQSLGDMPDLGFRWSANNYAWKVDSTESVMWARTPDQIPFRFSGQVGAADETIHPYGDSNFESIMLRSGGYIVSVRWHVGTPEADHFTKFNIFNGATLLGSFYLNPTDSGNLADAGQTFWDAVFTDTPPITYQGGDCAVLYTGDPLDLKVSTDYGGSYIGRPSDVTVIISIASGVHK